MELVSLYKFAKEKGVREQYIYGKFSADKIPKDCLVVSHSSSVSQTLLIRDRAELWWLSILAAREAKVLAAASKKKRTPVKDPTPESVIANIIQLTDSTTDPTVVENLIAILERLSKDK